MEVVLRRSLFAQRTRRVLEGVDALPALHGTEPAFRELERAGRRVLVLGVEDVPPCGVEVQDQARPLALPFQLRDQIANRLRFRLPERPPVAIEVRLPGVVPPVAVRHAIGVQQGHQHQTVAVEEPAARRPGRALLPFGFHQALGEAQERMRAAHFRRMLAAQQQQIAGRVGFDVHGPDRPPLQRAADLEPRGRGGLGETLAPLVVEGDVPVFLRRDVEPAHVRPQAEHSPRGVHFDIRLGQALPRPAIGTDLRRVAMFVPLVAQPHADFAGVRAQRADVEAVPGAGVDPAAVFRRDVHDDGVGA